MGNLKQGKMHHCLRGDGRPCTLVGSRYENMNIARTAHIAAYIL